VIHLQLPANLEAYCQESGRAGRDGENAWCTLLFLQDDKRQQQFFLVKHYPGAGELKTVYQAVMALATASCSSCSSAPVTFERIDAALGDTAAGKTKIALKLREDGRLLRQNRALAFVTGKAEPGATLFDELAGVYARKQERDREALEQMVSHAVSGFCRWKLMPAYFGDDVLGFEQCCRCDNCVNQPAALKTIDAIDAIDAIDIRDDEFGRENAAPPETPALSLSFGAGARVKVPKYDAGVVQSIAGDQVTIGFPDDSVRIFMAGFVVPA